MPDCKSQTQQAEEGSAHIEKEQYICSGSSIKQELTNTEMQFF